MYRQLDVQDGVLLLYISIMTVTKLMISRWDAFAPHFNYDCDLDPSLLGDGIAREKWSREYFEQLQR